MAHYLLQIAFTPDAFKGFVNKPEDRREAARKLIEAHGGTLIDYYFALGEYDAYLIYEMPDNVAAAATAITAAASGAFSKGRTVPLLTMDEAVTAMKKAKSKAKLYTPPAH